MRQTQFCRPLSDCLRAALIGDGAIAACVAHLLSLCGPSAIFGRIRAIVVDTFDGMLSAWTRSHVGHKRHEVIGPTGAHGDTPAAIVPIRLIRWPETAGFRGGPNLVFQPVLAAAIAVRSSIQWACFIVQASATLRAAQSQRLRGDGLARPAVTDAIPFGKSGRLFPRFDHKTPESLPAQIDQPIAHIGMISLESHGI